MKIFILSIILGVSVAAVPTVSAEMRDEEPSIYTNPASTIIKTLEGTLLRIESGFYVIQDSRGQEVRILVDADTKQVGPPKQLGDSIQATVTDSGKALSIE